MTVNKLYALGHNPFCHEKINKETGDNVFVTIKNDDDIIVTMDNKSATLFSHDELPWGKWGASSSSSYADCKIVVHKYITGDSPIYEFKLEDTSKKSVFVRKGVVVKCSDIFESEDYLIATDTSDGYPEFYSYIEDKKNNRRVRINHLDSNGSRNLSTARLKSLRVGNDDRVIFKVDGDTIIVGESLINLENGNILKSDVLYECGGVIVGSVRGAPQGIGYSNYWMYDTNSNYWMYDTNEKKYAIPVTFRNKVKNKVVFVDRNGYNIVLELEDEYIWEPVYRCSIDLIAEEVFNRASRAFTPSYMMCEYCLEIG